MHNFYIHTHNEEQMKHVLEQLWIADIIDEDVDNKYKRMYDITDKDLKKDYEWLVGFNHNTINYESPKVRLEFEDKKEVEKIFEVLNIKKEKNSYCWYPNKPYKEYKYVKGHVNNKYPIFIISKGRFRKRVGNRYIYEPPKTAKYLESCNIDYRIVVEKQEYDDYCISIDKDKVMILPDEYMNLDQGSIPVRNFVHHYNLQEGSYAYWLLDDNIKSYVYNDNDERYMIRDGFMFAVNENILNNYENLYLTGHQYKMFVVPRQNTTKIVSTHTRVYSSILIRTDIPTLNESNDIWRGKYNEDTDLSLRILKLGLPTLITNNIVADKEETGAPGGNHQIYLQDNNASGVLKSQALLEHHSDVVDIIKNYNRTHHKIKNSFIYKCRADIPLIKSEFFEKKEYDIKFYN
jgi:hypothetical protein